MSYATNSFPHKATAVRLTRIKSRFVAAYGTTGSSNLRGLTGKQARRYARAMRGADMANFGRVFS